MRATWISVPMRPSTTTRWCSIFTTSTSAGIANRFANVAPVRYFVMGANEWRDASGWPPTSRDDDLVFRWRRARTASAGCSRPSRHAGFAEHVHGKSARNRSRTRTPARPARLPRSRARKDVLTFETSPWPRTVRVAGDITAVIQASCDCRDFDLWVRLQDVYPDGRAFNLMSPGNDVLRASYRLPGARVNRSSRAASTSCACRECSTSIRFAKGHRIRAQISASFAPHLSRNLQTGESEVVSAASRPAAITIHHEAGNASRLLLPVLDRTAPKPRKPESGWASAPAGTCCCAAAPPKSARSVRRPGRSRRRSSAA